MIEYLAFGYAGALLEGIPLFGLFFMMTNVIGAALWAVDLEKSGMAPTFVGVTNSSANQQNINPIAHLPQQNINGQLSASNAYPQSQNSNQQLNTQNQQYGVPSSSKNYKPELVQQNTQNVSSQNARPSPIQYPGASSPSAIPVLNQQSPTSHQSLHQSRQHYYQPNAAQINNNQYEPSTEHQIWSNQPSISQSQQYPQYPVPTNAFQSGTTNQYGVQSSNNQQDSQRMGASINASPNNQFQSINLSDEAPPSYEK